MSDIPTPEELLEQLYAVSEQRDELRARVEELERDLAQVKEFHGDACRDVDRLAEKSVRLQKQLAAVTAERDRLRGALEQVHKKATEGMRGGVSKHAAIAYIAQQALAQNRTHLCTSGADSTQTDARESREFPSVHLCNTCGKAVNGRHDCTCEKEAK